MPYAGNFDGRLNAVCQSYNFPDSTSITPGQQAQMFAEAPNWRLLIQLSSNDGLNWGNCCSCSFFIERNALARLDFSNIQVTCDG
ncbi:hypothetical protein IAD21_03254 [Abditibacteriota bacterium]|nr:hypothetical protein IAD21_03254 [Abditibacteriota bacterium]